MFDHVERIDAFMRQETSGAEHDMLKQTIKSEGSIDPVTAAAVESAAAAESAAAQPVDTVFTLPGDLFDNWVFNADQQMYLDAFRW